MATKSVETRGDGDLHAALLRRAVRAMPTTASAAEVRFRTFKAESIRSVELTEMLLNQINCFDKMGAAQGRC